MCRCVTRGGVFGVEPLPFSANEQTCPFVVSSLYQNGRFFLRLKNHDSENVPETSALVSCPPFPLLPWLDVAIRTRGLQSSDISIPPVVFPPFFNLENNIHSLYLLWKCFDMPFFVYSTPVLENSQLRTWNVWTMPTWMAFHIGLQSYLFHS